MSLYGYMSYFNIYNDEILFSSIFWYEYTCGMWIHVYHGVDWLNTIYIGKWTLAEPAYGIPFYCAKYVQIIY